MVLSLYQLLRPSEKINFNNYQLISIRLQRCISSCDIIVIDSDLLLFLMYIVYILPEPTIYASISRSLKFLNFYRPL
jgi:hypothetical protein